MQELAAGLARSMRVIPLLFDGAAMPTEAQLPAPLRPLERRQALAIAATGFSADIDHLLALLVETLGEPAPAADAPGRGRRAVGGAVAPGARPRHPQRRRAGEGLAALPGLSR